MHILIQWLIYAVAILLSAYLLPGVKVAGFGVALVVALVLGLCNIFLRPLMILITIPLTILTFGLFLLVINTLLIQLTSSIVSGFQVRNFWWAFLFSIILSIINYILSQLAFAS